MWVGQKVTAMEGFADQVLIDMVCRRIDSNSEFEADGGYDARLLESDLRVLMDGRATEFAAALSTFIAPEGVAPCGASCEARGTSDVCVGISRLRDPAVSPATCVTSTGGGVARGWDRQACGEGVSSRAQGVGLRDAAGDAAAVANWATPPGAGASGATAGLGLQSLEPATLPLSVRPCANTCATSILGSAVCANVFHFDSSAAPPPSSSAQPSAAISAEDARQLHE